MTEPTVLVSTTANGVTTITLNRPDRRNALIEPMLADLTAAIERAGNSPASRGIVLTGAGAGFSAGQDLEAAASFGGADVDRILGGFNDVTRAILGTQVPVAAAINGIAAGGGAEITLACDVRLASASSEFYLPENKIGMPIGNATSYLLPRLVGSHALWLVIGSRRIDAHEAHRIGLFDRIVADDVLVETAVELMHEWGEPGRATRQHLRVMRPPMEEVEAAMAREVECARETLTDDAMPNGVRAHLERDTANRRQAQ